ncbi:MAG: DUF6119 family protein [Bacillota bacterium]
MELSIYKQVATRDDFIQYLREKEMHRIGESKTSTSRVVINEEEKVEQVVIDFFFKLDSEETVEIEWANYWSGFFGDASKKTKTVESAFGMIILEVDNNLYAISLGRGHSYASNFADMDFGFDIAEIIHDETSIDVKSAKFFKQSKNKSLTQYNTNSYVTSEIGESHELLVSKINVDDKYSRFLLYSYEDRMRFGSAVKLEISEYTPKDIIDIVHELHYIYLNEEKSGSLPRMNFPKNNEDNQPMISDLNGMLLDAIKSREPSVSLSYFMEDDGGILIEPAKDDSVEIIYDRRTHLLDTYSIESIGQKLNEIDCTDVSKVSIRPMSDKGSQISLLKILDYSTEYRRKDYCLYRGKWASFNKSYMDFIEREIVKVNECAIFIPGYNLTDKALEKGREIQASNIAEYDQVAYAEYPFNIFLKDEFNFILLDRKKGQHFYKSVEFADLYDVKENALIHVKIGSTPDIRYCIQQSIHSAEIFNTQSDALEVHGIDRVKKVSMLLVLQSENIILEDGTIDFSINKSIYLKIEIIEWLTKIRTLGYIPEILIVKDVRETKSKTKEEVSTT